MLIFGMTRFELLCLNLNKQDIELMRLNSPNLTDRPRSSRSKGTFWTYLENDYVCTSSIRSVIYVSITYTKFPFTFEYEFLMRQYF